jgi:hypothetical protein
MTTEFDDIRPFHDDELPRVYDELIADPHFGVVMESLFPLPFDEIARRMHSCKTVRAFQEEFCYKLLHKIARTVGSSKAPCKSERRSSSVPAKLAYVERACGAMSTVNPHARSRSAAPCTYLSSTLEEGERMTTRSPVCKGIGFTSGEDCGETILCALAPAAQTAP